MSIFLELKGALEDVRDYRAGKRRDLRITRFVPPKAMPRRKVSKIRKSLRVIPS